MKMRYKGEIKTYAEWAEITGIPARVIRQRRAKGWTAKAALETPIGQPVPMVERKGVQMREGVNNDKED